jgi:hypothetical protein
VGSGVVAGKASKGLRRGSKDGLSQRWRLGAAQFAPAELRFVRHGIGRAKRQAG